MKTLESSSIGRGFPCDEDGVDEVSMSLKKVLSTATVTAISKSRYFPASLAELSTHLLAFKKKSSTRKITPSDDLNTTFAAGSLKYLATSGGVFGVGGIVRRTDRGNTLRGKGGSC